MKRVAQTRRPGRPRAKLDIAKLTKLYLEDDLSTRDIAGKLGVSHITINRRIKELNLPARRWEIPDVKTKIS